MDLGESILEKLTLEDYEDEQDMDMSDVEEGEIVDRHLGSPNRNHIETNHPNENPQIESNVNDDSSNAMKDKKRNKKKRKKKKKNNNQNSGSSHFVFDLDRFVRGVCSRLKERKSYLVYSAVGVLGVAALGDLVKEVEAIQACGGQLTAQGNRNRYGGGVLWNILKTRDPIAYKEIMKKGRDFEKQFRRPWARPTAQKNAAPGPAAATTDKPSASTSDGDVEITPVEGKLVQQSNREKRRSVHDRTRVPVSYDDLPGEVSPNEPAS